MKLIYILLCNIRIIPQPNQYKLSHYDDGGGDLFCFLVLWNDEILPVMYQARMKPQLSGMNTKWYVVMWIKL